MEEAPLKSSFIFLIPVEESNPDSFISYVNQSLMTALNGMKELNGSSFGTKTSEELQPKEIESILNPIPSLMDMGCCILDGNILIALMKSNHAHEEN